MMNHFPMVFLCFPALLWLSTVQSEETTAASSTGKPGMDGDYVAHMKKLLTMLMENYTHTARPVRDSSKPMKISVVINVYHIEELNENEQTLTVHAWVTLLWMDEYLKWKDVPAFADYQEVENVQLPKSSIWHPDIGVHNSAKGKSTSGFHRYYYGTTRAVVSSGGRVLTTFDTAITAVCPTNLAKYPYDVQKCPIALGSWMYSMEEIQIDYIFSYHHVAEVLGLDRFHASGWTLKDSDSRKRFWTYLGVTDKQPEGQEESNIWAVLQLDMTLQRFAPYFGVIVALPCLTTLSLTLVSFWIPAWDVMVSSFSMSILLQAFFMRDAALTVPMAVDVTPRIIVFYGINLSITIAAFTFCILAKLDAENDVIPDSWSKTIGGVISSNRASFNSAKQSAIKTVRTLSIKSSGSLRQEDAGGIIENDNEGDEGDKANNEVDSRGDGEGGYPDRPSRRGEKGGSKNVTNRNQKEFQRVLLKRVVFGILSAIEILGWLVAVCPI